MPRTMQAGDTHPPIYLRATDPDTGVLLPVQDAQALEVSFRDGARLVTGPGVPLDPPHVDEKGKEWNVRYDPDADDFTTPGAYRTQTKITWAPNQVQRLPNTGGDVLTVEAANDTGVTP